MPRLPDKGVFETPLLPKSATVKCRRTTWRGLQVAERRFSLDKGALALHCDEVAEQLRLYS